jgi:hypothetical protein
MSKLRIHIEIILLSLKNQNEFRLKPAKENILEELTES